MSTSSKTNYKRISKLSDKDIDYSDIPETDEKFWSDAEVLFPTKKTHVSQFSFFKISKILILFKIVFGGKDVLKVRDS